MDRICSYICMVLIVLTLLMVAGCGGGGGGGGSSVQPFDTVAYQQMTATSSQAASTYASLVNQGDGTAAQQTVDWARTQPNIVYAEASSDGNAVWLEFDTGVVQVITQLPEITPEVDSQQSLTYRPTRDVASISGNKKALDLNAAWPDWPEGDNQDFMSMMSARGYEVEDLKAEQVDVQAFSHLNEYSVVYIDTHGPQLEDVPRIGPVFVTREEVTADRDNAQYANDLRNKDMIQAVVLKPQPDGTVLPYHGYYAITANFISNHIRGSFPQNSFVFAKSCSSMASPLMAQAFKSHGLGAYAGWDGPVWIPGSPNTASRVFDLLTAANHYPMSGSYPSADGKRLPMNLGNAVAAVKQEKFGTLGTVGANLLLAYGDSNALTFAPEPHLDRFTVDGSAVTLYGQFGTDRGKVIISEKEQNVLSWSSSEIKIRLPSDVGQGQTYVQTPQGLKSNELHISGPLSVFASGPYEVWASNDSPPYQEIEYYDVNTLPGYVKIGAAIGNAQFPSGYRFYVIATPSLIKLDAVRLPNLGYPTHTSNTLGSVFTWGNVHLPWKFDDQGNLIGNPMDYYGDDNIYGKEDGLTDDVGHPEGCGWHSRGYYEGIVLAEDPGWIPASQ